MNKNEKSGRRKRRKRKERKKESRKGRAAAGRWRAREPREGAPPPVPLFRSKQGSLRRPLLFLKILSEVGKEFAKFA